MLRRFIYILFSFVLCIVLAFFQRITGPTYPVKGKIEADNIKISYNFPRSCNIYQKKCIVKIDYHKDFNFYLFYKRYKVDEEFKKIDFEKKDNYFIAVLNDEYKPASKIEYFVYYKIGNESFKINDEPIVLRFKDKVNTLVIVLHVVLMFLFLTITFYLTFLILFEKKYSTFLFWLNYLTLFVGGFILGPLLQKQAFGVWWSGFPFGYDMTDNKTLLIFIFWSYAAYQLLINKKDIKRYILISSLITFLSYLVPHSLLGSEYDYTKDRLK